MGHIMKPVRMGVVVMVTALMCAFVSPRAEAADPFVASASVAVVDTDDGQLQGFVKNGIYTYRGVPYARAERFMMPEKVEKWKGVRTALSYGPVCPVPPMTEVASDELFNPHRYWPENEHCQYLNIWTPGIRDHKKRPVMVWLHGGGFTNGSSIEQVAYDGENLSRKGDVVVVSLNHRLNVLGYLDLSAYGEKYKYSGNVGMADIVAALKWIRANIAEFGGDPENVTIFGQSGGGSKVRILMGLPAAKGLVQKAIVQSGATLSPVIQQSISRRVAALTLQNLGLKPGQVDALRTMPYLRLLEAGEKALAQTAAENKANRGRWSPVLDGDYIPADPVGTQFAPQATDIPLMIGTVLDESNTVVRNDPAVLQADNKNTWSREHARAKLVEKYGDKADAVAKAFLEAYPEKKYADACFVDAAGRAGALRNAKLKAAQHGASVYTYIFTYESPVMDGIGMSWHCSEIPYVFDNVDAAVTATGGGNAAHVLAGKMSQAWINFARYGNPNHAGLPDWTAYTAENGATMIFDNTCEVRYHHDRELLDLLAPPLPANQGAAP